jgi:hypothetical protein
MPFQPDYRYMLDVLDNKQPARLPIYEHIISPVIMERILDVQFAGLQGGDGTDLQEFFTQYGRFFQKMTYDTVSFEVCITSILPDGGAIMGGRPGPIQNRDDFEKYPWDQLPHLYWEVADKQFDMLGRCLPGGMKAVGGVGNGVLEISEDLVGFQYLAYMMIDDPDLFADLYRKIGDLMVEIWAGFIQRYGQYFVVCRFGDDLDLRPVRWCHLKSSERTFYHSTNELLIWYTGQIGRFCGTLVAKYSASWMTSSPWASTPNIPTKTPSPPTINGFRFSAIVSVYWAALMWTPFAKNRRPRYLKKW